MRYFRTRRPAAALALVLSLGAGYGAIVHGQAPAARTASDVPAIPFEKYKLANGLEVLLSEDHRLPMVAVNVWYHVGPAYEEPNRTGFAHLFEHMMFQGSKHAPGDMHFRLVEGAGGSDINGTTGFDRTNYFQTLPANQLELGLWLESDRMGYLLDQVDQANLSNQQDVVRNERRQSIENRPYGIVDEAVFHLVFPKDHPYYASVIGSHADIQAAKLEDVQNFFKKYYAPGNASLAIVGDIDKAATKALVQKYFGTLKSGPPVTKPTVQTPPITAERRAVITDRVELPRVTMAWLTPPIFKPGDADADVAADTLGGGRTSRLYRSLVYEKQIAQNVSAYQQSMMLGSVFQIEVTARPGHTPQEIEAAIDEELAKFREAGPDQADVERARNQVETRTIQGLERFGGFGGVADLLNSYNHYLGDPGYLQQDIARYRAVTTASVRAFAQQYLSPTARVVVYGVPGPKQLDTSVPSSAAAQSGEAGTAGGAQSVNADEPWRREPPKPAAERTLRVPVPKSFKLANGLTVLFDDRQGLPVVSATLVVKTGSAANPIDKPGLASFTAAMLDEGTASRSALKIAEDVAQLGGSLSTGSAMDSMQVSIGSLSRTFPQMLDILADVVRRPSFPAAEVERQRASRLGQLAQQRDNPNVIASNVVAAALYGRAHPYGFPELGTEASTRAMTAADMRAFWQKNFVPNNAALVVAGRVTEAELRPMVDRAFRDWQPGTPDAPRLPAPQTAQARLIIVDTPGAPQTQLRVAEIGAARSTPEYESLRVLNETLGGLFSSRINLNLREQHGYTYGARSGFTFWRTAGPFSVATGVRTDVTGPAVSEILKELARARDSDVTSDELTLAKDALIRSLPANFETSSRVTGSTTNLFVYDLEPDYFVNLQRRYAAVGTPQVRAAAEKYIVPGNAIVIAVGDRQKIQPELEKLGIGPVEVWNADGVPEGAR
jgi:zinc protease